MKSRKTLQELTIKDNFMFGAVMLDEDNCRRFLEMSLGFQIEHLEVSKEKSMVYHPEYKGIRLDVYAKDERNTRYNVEMQVAKQTALSKRSRYYHSQIDMELLIKGENYEKLPDTYVIFVCDFDPFEEGKYCYTFANRCFENNQLLLNDGCCTIFLSTKGKNDEEVPKSLVTFLKFAGAELEDSWEEYGDDFVKQLQKSIHNIKASREMGERYMLFEELLQDEREEGREEGRKEALLEYIFVLLEELGSVSDEVKELLMAESDRDRLSMYLRKAAKASSIEEFQKEVLNF